MNYPRPWTLDVNYGVGAVTSPKRECTKCHNLLGDVTDREMQGLVSGAKMPETTGECGFCNGLHVLCADPQPKIGGPRVGYMTHDEIKAYAQNPDVVYGALCPYADNLDDDPFVRPCTMWVPCGCEPILPGDGEDIAATAAELERMEGDRCPKSPTRQHKVLAGALMRPTEQCVLADNPDLQDIGEVTVTKPGRYPVTLVSDGDGLTLTTVEPPFVEAEEQEEVAVDG